MNDSNGHDAPKAKELVVATALAFVGACVLLITIVFPAEYGKDLTGIGKALGLTDMAEDRRELKVHSNPKEGWSDEVTLTIPGKRQAELKLTMSEGDEASFEWAIEPPKLHSDLHGDGAEEKFVSYKKTDGAIQDSGNVKAQFDGVHGWYWENQGSSDVAITLRTKGTYGELKRVH